MALPKSSNSCFAAIRPARAMASAERDAGIGQAAFADVSEAVLLCRSIGRERPRTDDCSCRFCVGTLPSCMRVWKERTTQCCPEPRRRHPVFQRRPEPRARQRETLLEVICEGTSSRAGCWPLISGMFGGRPEGSRIRTIQPLSRASATPWCDNDQVLSQRFTGSRPAPPQVSADARAPARSVRRTRRAPRQ